MSLGLCILLAEEGSGQPGKKIRSYGCNLSGLNSTQDVLDQTKKNRNRHFLFGKSDRIYELRFRLRLRIEFTSDTPKRREAENLCVHQILFLLGTLEICDCRLTIEPGSRERRLVLYCYLFVG